MISVDENKVEINGDLETLLAEQETINICMFQFLEEKYGSEVMLEMMKDHVHLLISALKKYKGDIADAYFKATVEKAENNKKGNK